MAGYNMNDFAINYPPAGGNPQTAGNWMTKLNDWLGSPQGPLMLGQIGSALVANDPKQWQTHLGNFNAQISQSRIAAEQAAKAQAQKNSMLNQLLSGLGDQGLEGPTNLSISRDPKTGNYLMNVKSTVSPDKFGQGGGGAGSAAAGGGAGNYQYTTPLPMAQQPAQAQSFNTPSLGSLLQGNQAQNQSYKTYPF